MLFCLIVDDDSDCRLVASEIVRMCGMEVEEALDGLHALELCKKRMPDVIILDWMMPTMSGVEFLTHLRKIENGHHPNVIMCSAKFSEYDINKGFDHGANEYIRKPVRTRDLTGVLNAIMNR